MRAYTASYFGSNSPPQNLRFLRCRENGKLEVSFENDWDKAGLFTMAFLLCFCGKRHAGEVGFLRRGFPLSKMDFGFWWQRIVVIYFHLFAVIAIVIWVSRIQASIWN